MGDPRKLKNAFQGPKRPWEAARLTAEKKVVEKYGIRRKRELWRVQSTLRKYRNRAKDLIASPNTAQQEILIKKLNSLGVVGNNATLDDVLSLQTETLLERRLQTMVVKRQLANTPKQARQFIVHGHIQIGEQKVISPGYLVTTQEEGMITFKPTSILATNFKVAEKKKTKEEPKAAEPATPEAAPVEKAVDAKEEIVLQTEELLGTLEKEDEETEAGKAKPARKKK